jgi:hypothetical protein
LWWSCQENKQLTIPLLGTVAALRARSEPTGVAKNLANLASGDENLTALLELKAPIRAQLELG